MRLRAFLLASGFSLLASGCGSGSVAAGDPVHEVKFVDLDQAPSTRVHIKMGAGELKMRSGTAKLLEAVFDYNVDAWKPIVEHGPGYVTISQPKELGTTFGKTIYKWDISVNRDVPVDVTAELGAGQAVLELGALNLRSVEVDLGAGEAELDLRGKPRQSFHVQARGGVGLARIYLPKDAVIAATVTGGIGSLDVAGLEKHDGVWVNPDMLTGPVKVTLDIKGGVGEIKMVRAHNIR